MLEALADFPAIRLDAHEYNTDFEEEFWRTDASWKLERGQDFAEPGLPSWEALTRGDWGGALQLGQGLREYRTTLQGRLDAKGIVQSRVRVVSWPLTPYVQWELNLLMIWAELGERIAVISDTSLQELEGRGRLPEILILGEKQAPMIMYEILYHDDGTPAGARKFTDSGLVKACREDVQGLWSAGEELATYFTREIKDLPPPR